MVNEEKCFECRHAEWDYETYYGTTRKEWFVCDCKLGYASPTECEEYDEFAPLPFGMEEEELEE